MRSRATIGCDAMFENTVHDNDDDQLTFQNTRSWSTKLVKFIKTCISSVTVTTLTPNLLLQVRKHLVINYMSLYCTGGFLLKSSNLGGACSISSLRVNHVAHPVLLDRITFPLRADNGDISFVQGRIWIHSYMWIQTYILRSWWNAHNILIYIRRQSKSQSGLWRR